MASIWASFGEEESDGGPHSLTLFEQQSLICVADREKGRILCYDAGLQQDVTSAMRRLEINPDLAASMQSTN